MTESFTHRALDPARSVVVEACAGSGKTWLLVSRMLRILLDGARPGDILAITYTRKAAREIEARLRLWLRELARVDDAEACAFLVARGVGAYEAPGILPRARRLIETVEQASPGVTITTFHGWFGRILAGASLSSGLAGFTLADAEQPLLDEAWTIFARQCAKAPDGAEACALTELFETFGMASTRALLGAFVARRAEWQVYRGDASLDEMIERLGHDLGATTDAEALAGFFESPTLRDDCARYADFLARNTKTDAAAADRLRSALAMDSSADLPAARFDALFPVFITGTGTPRIKKASVTQAKRLTPSGEAELLALHAELCERVQRCIDARTEVRILAFNAAALRAGTALLDAFEHFKRSRRLFDYADLEVHVDRLLCDEGQAPYLQARLDARYRHLLLDEFQDTNPLQWRILLAWLSAYDVDAWRPSIFMVGDPKQSIYRFRRADARIFAHAADWLGEHFGAARLPNNHTWRNAPAVVEVVNAVFEDAPAFTGFEPQLAHRTELAGQVMLLPLVEPPADDEPDVSEGLRDPLSVARVFKENIARRLEAQQMVETLADWVGRVGIGEGGARRPMQWGDVLILTRTRGILPEYERALREAGVPYYSVSRGQLLTTLEAADLIALLNFLTTPSDDLALVHTLRTPLFDLADDTLLALAAREEKHWWARLQALADSPDEHGAAARAADALTRWIARAAQLPVHDLLDRIYHEADVMAAYRRRVPPPMWAGVRANLEAFLALALGIDGGRYPSLSRFVAELARLGRASDEEAPDEGLLVDAGDGGRVRIMTIHGAKGLEAPVVWLIDANNAHQRPDNYQPLIDWPVGAEVPTHFSLHASGKLKGRARDAVFEAEAAAAEREALNLLYVAITRAEQAFVASGSVSSRGGGESYYTLLQGALEALSDGASHGVMRDAELADTPATLVPNSTPLPAPAPVGERLAPAESNTAKDFGIAMHAFIEARTTPGAAVPQAVPEAVRRAAATIVDAPDMQRFFDANCFEAAWNEVEIVQADGRLGRIDRLVVFDEAVWVLDYKSGSVDAPMLDRYRLQLEGYRDALAGMFGARSVHGMLVFADGERHSL